VRTSCAPALIRARLYADLRVDLRLDLRGARIRASIPVYSHIIHSYFIPINF